MRKFYLWILCVCTAAIASAAQIAGEIAHYPMREGKGNKIYEAQKRLPAGEIKRSFWTIRDTLPLVDFGGMKKNRDAYVQMPEIKLDGDFTIAVWVNAYWWKNNWAGLVVRSESTYGLRGNSNCPGQLHFRVKEAGAERGTNLMSNMILDRNRWYHVDFVNSV